MYSDISNSGNDLDGRHHSKIMNWYHSPCNCACMHSRRRLVMAGEMEGFSRYYKELVHLINMFSLYPNLNFKIFQKEIPSFCSAEASY